MIIVADGFIYLKLTLNLYNDYLVFYICYLAIVSKDYGFKI
jgi:hypothetical protein